MNNNQIESSIRFIHRGIPQFIRLSYETFLTVENEIYSHFKAIYSTNPDSANKLIEAIFNGSYCNWNFMSIIDNLMKTSNSLAIKNFINESLRYRISDFVNSGSAPNDGKCNPYSPADQERIDSIDFGDIIAPVTSIIPMVSAFTNVPGLDFPAMLFEPVQDFGASASYVNPFNFTEKSNNDRFMNLDVVRNSVGQIDAFDTLVTNLRVDANNLFTIYFKKAVEKFCKSITTFEDYEALHDHLRNTDYNDIINDITTRTLRSAIATYLVYAGKLCGSKKDVYDWLYTAFVRDASNQLEQGLYPTSSDISTMTGHVQDRPDKLYGVPGAENIVDKRETDDNAKVKGVFNDKDHSYNENLMFKLMRLQYSNWASVINLITQLSFKRSGASSFSYNKEECFNNDDGQALQSDRRSDTGILETANLLMYEYIKARFSTYNSETQPAKAAFIKNTDFMAVTMNRIYDPVVKSIVKDDCNPGGKGIDLHTYFFPNGDREKGILKANELTKNVVGDLFMMCAYLSLLTYAHDHSATILEQAEPMTGRSKRELFEEIYFSLKRKIDETLDMCMPDNAIRALISGRDSNRNKWNDSFGDYAESIRNAFVGVYAYTADHGETGKVLSDKVRNAFNLINGVTSKLSLTPAIKPLPGEKEGYGDNTDSLYDLARRDSVTRTIVDLFVIPPLTNFLNIRYGLSWDNVKITGSPSSDFANAKIFTRASSLYPKNKVTTELCSQNLGVTKVFASLEAAEGTLEEAGKAADPESLWAHMSYNEIGAIGGAVYDLEDTMNPPNDTQQAVSDIGIQIADATAGNDIPHDSEDVKKLSSEAYLGKIDRETYNLKVQSIVSRYNNLFAKVILGKK